MVTHIVDGKSRVHLPRRPLAVTMSIVGSPGAAALQARHAGGPDPDAIAHNDALLILPRVQHDTTIVVIPGSGLSAFPPGTTVHVAISVDSSREPDPDRAQLTPRDVSGLTSLELATIGLDGDLLSVTTRLDEPEIPLGHLASRARAAARTALGMDQIADDAQRPVDVLIDTSLSMLGSVRDGSVKAALDIVAGVCAVVAADHPPVVRLMGASATELARIGIADLAETTQLALESVRFGVGFDTPIRSGSAERTTFLITDSSASKPDSEHATTIVLSNSRAAFSDPSFGGAVIAPAADGYTDTSARLLSDPEEIDDIVDSIVRSMFGSVDSGMAQ